MPFWSVAQTETSREAVAVHFLTQQNFETYLPRIKAKTRTVPLFPGYVFVKISDHWWSINNTIAVIRLLQAGDQPARLEDKIINNIKNKERNGVVKLPEKNHVIKRGTKIKIINGSFAGHIALYEGMSGQERSRVLLELLGRKVLVEIKQSDLQVAS